MSENATDIDDTSFAFFKRREKVANELDRCSQVDGNNAVKKGDIGILQMSTRCKGGIVDEAIDSAKAVEGFSGDLCRAFGILKITFYESCVFRSKLFLEGIGSFDIASVENDFGTFLREEAGHRGADPGGAAGDEDDVILLGDLNASEKELGNIKKIPGIQWVVGGGVMTNTRQNKAYDNIIFCAPATQEFTGRWNVLNFEEEFNLSREQALRVSDHFPVWAEFDIWESTNAVH